jgi:heat shock protein HslJ
MHRRVMLALTLCALAPSCSRNDPPAAAATVDSVALIDVEWRLTHLGSEPAPVGAGDRQVTMRFAGTEGRVSGFGGCNRYAGTYVLRGDSLRFSPLMMTRMACDKGMDLEVRYAALLETVRRARVANGALELLAGDSIVARYKRAP